MLPFFQALPHGLFGVGIDAVPAQDAWGLGFPGFQGMGWTDAGPGMNHDAIRTEDGEPTSSTSPTATPRSRGCWCGG